MTFGKKAVLAGLTATLVVGGAVMATAQNAMHHPRFEPMGPMGKVCESDKPLSPELIRRLGHSIKPTEAQKAEFDAFGTALDSAEKTVKASCPTDKEAIDHSPSAMLSHMEQHLTVMLSAVKTVRPACDALYAKLDDRQRDALRWSMPFIMHEHPFDHGHAKMIGDAPKEP
jgi:hypothetical protein